MDFPQLMDYLFYRGSVGELRMLNSNDYTCGISYHSMLYLNVIAYERECTVSKLAELLHITTSAAVIKVGELARQDLVEKVRSLDDGRVHHLRLTQKTLEIYEQYSHISAETHSYLLSKYTGAELNIFNKILREVAEYEP